MLSSSAGYPRSLRVQIRGKASQDWQEGVNGHNIPSSPLSIFTLRSPWPRLGRFQGRNEYSLMKTVRTVKGIYVSNLIQLPSLVTGRIALTPFLSTLLLSRLSNMP